MRIHTFDQIVGQTINKSIILNQLAKNSLSKFIFLYGDSGSGKSTMGYNNLVTHIKFLCSHTKGTY